MKGKKRKIRTKDVIHLVIMVCMFSSLLLSIIYISWVGVYVFLALNLVMALFILYLRWAAYKKVCGYGADMLNKYFKGGRKK